MKLLPDENFEVTQIPQKNDYLSDAEINEKYSKGEIRIITEQARYPLDSIVSMLDSGKYDLNPEYQRRKRWDVKQQSKLIESFIINVPIPPIFIYEVSYAQYEVMDGLQRLTAIYDFYKNKYSLEGLEEWSELNGRKYLELPKSVREGIDRRYLSSIVLLNETAKDPEIANSLKQMVFGRLNSGGDKLEPQETRNALYMGKFNDLCIKLSLDNNFRKIWNYKLVDLENGIIKNEENLLEDESYRKMADVEMVLRYFAFRHLESLSNAPSQEKFLDKFLNRANKYSEEVLNGLERIFLETCSLIYEVFEKAAFYMPPGIQQRDTPTKTMYDPMMQVMSEYITERNLVVENKSKIRDLLYRDINKATYRTRNKDIPLFDGKYSSKPIIEKRMEYIRNVIEEAIRT